MYRVYYYTFDYSKYYATMTEAHAAGRASGFNEYTITKWCTIGFTVGFFLGYGVTTWLIS